MMDDRFLDYLLGVKRSVEDSHADALLANFLIELLPDSAIQFDGPLVTSVFGKTYSGLASVVSETKIEAIAKYLVRLNEFTEGAEQVAWRVRPRLERKEGGFRVFSRLAVHRRPIGEEAA